MKSHTSGGFCAIQATAIEMIGNANS